MLADEAGGAGLQEAPDHVLGVLGAERQDRHLQATRPHPRDHVQAVQARQVDIDDKQVRLQVDGHRQRIDAVLRLAHHLVSGAFQQQAHGMAGYRVLVGDQYSTHGAFPNASCTQARGISQRTRIVV
ncbi:hypothetical protein D3C81_1771840 [compost metagenome]